MRVVVYCLHSTGGKKKFDYFENLLCLIFKTESRMNFMKFKLFAILTLCLLSTQIIAQEIDSNQMYIDEVENSLKYQTGKIKLDEGNATLTVPMGFKYLDRAQSIYVLTDLWGNPTDSSVLGLLVPEKLGVLGVKRWVFEISFEEMGYVKDDDADDIDYDDLLKDLQKDITEGNPERVKEGYDPITLVGWASVPFYDKDKKVLHWAKEVRFGDDSLSTLNYNLRILGRKGVYVLNAIASMSDLPEVKANIGKVLNSVTFEDGNKYADFDPGVDEVAAWTIGGLVAGKILAKAGIFAVLAKFAKVIVLAIIAGATALWKFITGRRRKEDEPAVEIAKDDEPADNA